MEARDEGSARTRARCGDLSKGRASMGACTDRSAARGGGCSSLVVASASWHQWPDWRTERKVFGVEGLDSQAISGFIGATVWVDDESAPSSSQFECFPTQAKGRLEWATRRNNNFEASSRLLLWQAEQKHLSIFFSGDLHFVAFLLKLVGTKNSMIFGHKAPPHIRTKRRRKSSHFDQFLHLPAVEHFPNA